MSEAASNINVRRSSRLVNKRLHRAKTCPACPVDLCECEKGLSVRTVDPTDDELQPQFADSRKILDITKENRSDSRKSQTKSTHKSSSSKKTGSIVRKQNQARIEVEIKKKQIEQEALRKEKELLDLQLAMTLAQIEEENSESGENCSEFSGTESVVTEQPNLQNWMSGKIPWEKSKSPENAVVEVLNTSGKVRDDYLNKSEVYSI